MQEIIRGGEEDAIMIAGRSEGTGVVGERGACACGKGVNSHYGLLRHVVCLLISHVFTFAIYLP